MRRGLIAACLLAWLVAPAAGIAQEPTADDLIQRLREAARDIPSAAAPGAPGDRPEIEGGLGAEQIRTRIADDLGVEVLDVRTAEIATGPVYAVKIMNPPGNSNSALMVGTLVVDPESGEVLGRAERFRTFSESPPLALDPDVDAGGLEMRRRTYR